jgi:hypothetical protein
MLKFCPSFSDLKIFNFYRSPEVTLGMPIILFVLICTALYFVVGHFGMLLPTAIVAAVLATAFKIRYLRQGWGFELAYWGLAYVAAAVLILGIGLVQSHYGCIFLIGDCYQPQLPNWVDPVKRFWRLYLLTLNTLAIYRVFSLLVPQLMPQKLLSLSKTEQDS